MGLVVAIIPALAGVYAPWRIDSTWRRSFTQRPGLHVVCLVVLIIVVRGNERIIGAGVASGPALLHVTPSSWALDLPPSGRRIHYRAIEDRADEDVRLRSNFLRALATLAGFAANTLTAVWVPEITPRSPNYAAYMKLPSAHMKGETITTAAMAAYAYDQTDQARTELNAVSK